MLLSFLSRKLGQTVIRYVQYRLEAQLLRQSVRARILLAAAPDRLQSLLQTVVD